MSSRVGLGRQVDRGRAAFAARATGRYWQREAAEDGNGASVPTLGWTITGSKCRDAGAAR